MAKRLREYAKKRGPFLEGKRCAVFPHLVATDVHHVRGRITSLLTDERYWLPVSRAGHYWINNSPKKAQEMGWLAQLGQWNSVDRSKP